MSAAKKKIEAPEVINETPVVDELSAALVEIPAKICVQIGQRKRYFSTREEALAALTEFNTRGAAKASGPKRTFLTPEQKAAKAAAREILLAYAVAQGKEGKNAAALANTLEDLIAEIPGVLQLVTVYNLTPKVAPEDTTAVVAAPVDPAVAASSDPLAEFDIA